MVNGGVPYSTLISLITRKIATAAIQTTVFTMMASTSEYLWRRDNIKVSGIVFSCSSMGIKLWQGLGTALSGGGFRVVDRAIWLPEMMNFARNGDIVSSVDYRTCNEESFPGALIDAKAAIRYCFYQEQTWEIMDDFLKRVL